jgi:four helix bundle protein
MNTAQGSLEESRYYLLLAQDLGCAQTQDLRNALDEISRLLDAYARSIVRNS